MFPWRSKNKVRKQPGASPAFAAHRWRELRLERLEDRNLPAPSGLAYGQIPLSFEANQGQADGRGDFLAHGAGYGVFLAGGDAVLSLRKFGASQASFVRMDLVG